MKIRWHHLRFLHTALKQPLDFRIEHDELDDFDARFYRIIQKHLTVPGWWSILKLLLQDILVTRLYQILRLRAKHAYWHARGHGPGSGGQFL